LDKLCAGEMFRAENRQRDGETQIAQGGDLVQAVGLGDVIFGGQYADEKKNDSGRTHGDGGAGDFEECEENCLVHRIS